MVLTADLIYLIPFHTSVTTTNIVQCAWREKKNLCPDFFFAMIKVQNQNHRLYRIDCRFSI
jgi:hypothetical protein